MADSGYKNISRIDVPKKKTHGWYVRIQHRGKSYAKFFNDSLYGDKEEALLEAVEYRNDLEAELGRPRTERYYIGPLHPNNNTGVPGVIRTQKTEKKRGRSYTYNVFEVTWCPDPGKVSRTTVSIDKHGEAEAFHRACKIRKARLQEIYGTSEEPSYSWLDNHELVKRDDS